MIASFVSPSLCPRAGKRWVGWSLRPPGTLPHPPDSTVPLRDPTSELTQLADKFINILLLLFAYSGWQGQELSKTVLYVIIKKKIN